jgi:hypothetical protein
VSFEAIAQALATAAVQRSVTPAESVVELLGLKEQAEGKTSQTRVWERTDGSLSLWLQWHWYDQSHPFSIQPEIGDAARLCGPVPSRRKLRRLKDDAGEDICGWRNRATLTPITDRAHTDPSGCPMPSVDQNDNAKLEALREAEGNSGPADDEDDDDPMAQLRYVPEGMKHSDFEIGKT